MSIVGGRRRGFGLALLRPPVRLLIAVLFCSAFTYASSPRTAAIAFATSTLIYCLNGMPRYPRLLAVVILSTATWLFVGNVLFSPQISTGADYSLFRINEQGLWLGITAVLKRLAMLMFGFAALECSDLLGLYDGAAFFAGTTFRKWVLQFFRLWQRTAQQYLRARQTIRLRGGGNARSILSIRARIRDTRLLLTAVISRLFQTVGVATFAGEARSSASTAAGRIVADGVSVRYAGSPTWAIEHISFSIEPGSVVFLAGRGRGGKTTLLRALCGYVPRVTGEMLGTVLLGTCAIGEMEIDQISEMIRFISEDSSDAIVGLTVGQELTSLAKSVNDAHAVAEYMGIADLWDRSTDALSGGQRARVVLSGVLASAAPILLLDSPLQELDQAGRRDFVEALLSLRNINNTTVLIADPFIHEFLPYVDRIIELEDGRVIGDFTMPVSVSRIRALIHSEQWIEPPEDVAFSDGRHTIASMTQVGVTRDGEEILNAVDLSIDAHDFVAVTGPNGSGKTTAMLTLVGLLQHTAGTVWRSPGLRVGMVFQEAPRCLLCPTVGDELRLPSVLQGLSPDIANAFADRQLTWLGLRGRESTLDLDPSSARLVATAASVSDDISLIVFDEPTLGLDERDAAKVIRLVVALWREGKAVAVISHDPRLIRLAKRVVSIGRGQVVDRGPYSLTPIASHRLNTTHGPFAVTVFEYGQARRPVVAMVRRPVAMGSLLRVQFGCLYSTALGSIDCDCHLQIERSLELLGTSPVGGVMIYLPSDDGRGHGLLEKARIVEREHESLQGSVASSRDAGQRYANYESLDCLPIILDALSAGNSVTLLTNSPLKCAAVMSVGVRVHDVVKIDVDSNGLSEFAAAELSEKRTLLGHIE